MKSVELCKRKGETAKIAALEHDLTRLRCFFLSHAECQLGSVVLFSCFLVALTCIHMKLYRQHTKAALGEYSVKYYETERLKAESVRSALTLLCSACSQLADRSKVLQLKHCPFNPTSFLIV